MKVSRKQTKEMEPFWYSVYHSAYSISHTFSPQWLMPLWKEAEMAVARLHGKVKCRPFKEKGRRAPLTKRGITGDGLFVPRFPLLNLFCFCLYFFLCVFEGAQCDVCSFLSSFLPPGIRLQCLPLSKGLDPFEWALWIADLMVRQCFLLCSAGVRLSHLFIHL